MSGLHRVSRRDLELLSAYLDDALSGREAGRLESRLQTDPSLRQALGELRETAQVLGALPEVRPPRNYLLTPDMVGQRRPRAPYPTLQLATALATMAFLVVVGVDVLTSRALGAGTGLLPAAAPLAMEVASEEIPVEGEALKEGTPAPEMAQPAADEAMEEPQALAEIPPATATGAVEREAAPAEPTEAPALVEPVEEGVPTEEGDLIMVPEAGAVGAEELEPDQTFAGEEVVEPEPPATVPSVERGFSALIRFLGPLVIRFAEVLFGMAAITLAVLTLRARRRG